VTGGARTASRPATPNGSPPTADGALVVCAARDRLRVALRAAFPKRRARLVYVRGAAELRRTLCAELVDAVLVDLGAGTDDGWAAAGLARDFGSTAFVAVAPLRASEGAMLARCASLGLADVLVDGVDDAALRGLVAPLGFTWRFAAGMRTPPPILELGSRLQRAAWVRLVEAGGRMTRTSEVAATLGVTREHLSRSFARAAPLKGLLDLVRVLVAAELARSPGYAVQDIATVLGFATSSHFARTARRVAGCTPVGLGAMTGGELIARFAARRGGDGAAGMRDHTWTPRHDAMVGDAAGIADVEGDGASAS
jgi:AraC-like DNA-binding protein